MTEEGKQKAASAGLTLGAALAISMSWGLHHSILLAIVHGCMSWLYVIAWALS